MARQILLDPVERKEFMARIMDDWRSDVQARSEWMKDKEVWFLLYNNVPPEVTPRYEGEPNFVIPVIMTTKETLHSRLVSALFGLDDVVQTKPYGKTTQERVKKITEFMNWEIQVEMDGVSILDDWIGDILVYGVSPLMVRWHRETRTEKRIETFPAKAPPMYPAMREVFQELKIPITEGDVGDEQYIRVLWEDAKIRPQGNGEFIVLYEEDNREKEVEVFVDRSMADDMGIIEVEILERVTIYDGPRIEVIDVEDFIMPPGYPDIQKAPRCFHRRWLEIDEIAQMVERHIYDVDEETMTRLRTMSLTNNASSKSGHAIENNIKEMREDIKGIEYHETRRQSFEVVDAYYKWDINNDGYDEEIVVTFLPEYNIWLAGQYLSVYYPHRRRPFVAGRIIPRTNQFEGIGIPELTAPFQEELSAMFNAKMRKDEFTSTPFGAYRPASGMKSQIYQIAPGKLIPTDDPGKDLNIVTMSPSTIADLGNINLLMNFLERLTGVSDFSSGTFGSRPNAPRTFGATAAIIQEGNVRYDMYIRRLSQSMGQLFEHIHALNNVFMPKSKSFFVLGSDEPQTIDRNFLDGQFHFQLITNTRNTNKAIMRDFATFVYQNLLSNPLIASNVGALYKLAKMFAEAHEVRNFREILPEPPEAMMRPPMDQMEEIAVMATGEYLDVLPTDNDEEHIEQLMQFLESPMADRFPHEFSSYLLLHLKKHNDQLRLKQSQGVGGAGGVMGVQPGPEAPDGQAQGGPAPNAGSTNINQAGVPA
jgi:hypothetical protein